MLNYGAAPTTFAALYSRGLVRRSKTGAAPPKKIKKEEKLWHQRSKQGRLKTVMF